MVLTGNDFESAGIGVELVGDGTHFVNNHLTITGGRINAQAYGVRSTAGWNFLTMTGTMVVVSSASQVAGLSFADTDNVTVTGITLEALATPNAIVVTGTTNSNFIFANNMIPGSGMISTLFGSSSTARVCSSGPFSRTLVRLCQIRS